MNSPVCPPRAIHYDRFYCRTDAIPLDKIGKNNPSKAEADNADLYSGGHNKDKEGVIMPEAVERPEDSSDVENMPPTVGGKDHEVDESKDAMDSESKIVISDTQLSPIQGH